MPGVAESDLRDAFYSFGEITGIRIIELRRCAFVTFAERSQAERAAQELSNKLIIKGTRCKLMWGRPQERRLEGAPGAVPPSMLPPQVGWLLPAACLPKAGGGCPARACCCHALLGRLWCCSCAHKGGAALQLVTGPPLSAGACSSAVGLVTELAWLRSGLCQQPALLRPLQ